jgi:hypothetical protein
VRESASLEVFLPGTSTPYSSFLFIETISRKPEQASSAILLDLDNGTRLPEAPLSPSLHDLVTLPGTAEEANMRALSVRNHVSDLE